MVPCLHQGNIYTKRKLRVWRADMYSASRCNYPHLPVRAVKIPRLEGGGIGPRTESCVNWDGPIAMVPCLHQGNIYTKRKLRVWRDQKCIPLVGAITPLTCAGRQNTPPRGRRYRAQNGKLRNFRTDLSSWCRVCTKEIFIPKGSYGYGESRYVLQQVGAIPPLTCAGR